MNSSSLASTVRLEGALFSRDFLDRLGALSSDLPHLSPQSYGLAPEDKLREKISASWNALSGRWDRFQSELKKLSEDDYAVGITRREWLLPVLQELNFGRVQTANAIRLTVGDESKEYAISHGWNRTPLHLLGARVSLDVRTQGLPGAAQMAPHALVQECLNRSGEHLWAVLSNGYKFRVLRDSAAIARRSYVEFDLEAIFENEDASGFALFWLLCHASRFEWRAAANEENEANPPILEDWQKETEQEGVRARDVMRGGVQGAIEHIGTGLLRHKDNKPLREELRSGALLPLDFYKLTLRLVYRLLFILVAEAKDNLLLPVIKAPLTPNPSPPNAALGTGESEAKARATARERYENYYSLAKLRQRAAKTRGTAHEDAWQGLCLTFQFLRGGEEGLAIPALGGFLFQEARLKDGSVALEECHLANEDLFAALRQLCYFQQGAARRQVNFTNLGSEELGSVYESLLELTPRVDLDGYRFQLETLAGNERKITGSYYTPEILVKSLLDSALEPVIEAALRRAASGEQRMENVSDGELLSGFGSVGTRDDSGGTGLSVDTHLSEGRIVRSDFAATEISEFDSGEHRRGMGQGKHEGIPAISEHSDGQSARNRNASDSGTARGIGDSRTNSAFATEHGNLGASASESATQPTAQTRKGNVNPLATRHSLLAAQEKALLSLRICDPACGSGHFLTAAARRVASRLALLRTQGNEPEKAEYQHALREVVGHCIYGIDVNEMAVELCKIALWMEGLEAGRPLSFLDSHIRCGNSLLGATPDMIENGLPDEAFAALEGDDKTVVSALKKRNKLERDTQTTTSLFVEEKLPLGDLRRAIAEIEQVGDEQLEGVQQKERMLRALEQSGSYDHTHLLYDAWCAAFVWKKVPDTLRGEGALAKGETNPNFIEPLTTEGIRYIQQSALPMFAQQRPEIKRLRGQYKWFHPHLEFPAVFGDKGGFDVILGNPPWERVKLQEKEWFAARSPEIAGAPNAAARGRLIEQLKSGDPVLHGAFLDDKRRAEGESHFARSSDRFPLCGRGDVNTYALFAELNRNFINDSGRVGCIVPSGIATDDTTKFFFGDLVERQSLISLYDFQSSKGLFSEIGHARFKFCCLTMCGANDSHGSNAEFAFFLRSDAELQDAERRFKLSPDEIALLNPNTKTCPIFRSSRDAELTKAIYRRVPVLVNESTGANPWGIKFSTMFHMSNDSGLFENEPDEGRLPLYEAKMLHHFDHRWATYENGDTRDVSDAEKNDPQFVVQPRYWVAAHEVKAKMSDKWDKKWLLGFRDICRSTDERTVIASVLPRVGCGNKIPLMIIDEDVAKAACLIANLTAFPYDYTSRQKIGSTTLNYFIFKQLPVLPPSTYDQTPSWTGDALLRDWIARRVLELTYTAYDLRDWAHDLGYDGEPFGWDTARRFALRCELDAAFFHLYGLTRDETAYVLDTFPIVRRKDERDYGTYRTKDEILRLFDEMAALCIVPVA